MWLVGGLFTYISLSLLCPVQNKLTCGEEVMPGIRDVRSLKGMIYFVTFSFHLMCEPLFTWLLS